MTFYQGATGGGVWKTERRRPQLAQRLRRVLRHRIGRRDRRSALESRASSTSGWARRASAATRRTVTACTSRSTAAKPGRISVSTRRSRSRECAIIRRTRISSTSRRSAMPWGPSPDRGVYRSKDGGRTWEKVLFRSNDAGAIDLVMDRSQPRRDVRVDARLAALSVGVSERRPGHGAVQDDRRRDDVERADLERPGLPTGTKGRIGVALAPSRRTASGRSSTRRSDRRAFTDPMTAAARGST